MILGLGFFLAIINMLFYFLFHLRFYDHLYVTSHCVSNIFKPVAIHVWSWNVDQCKHLCCRFEYRNIAYLGILYKLLTTVDASSVWPGFEPMTTHMVVLLSATVLNHICEQVGSIYKVTWFLINPLEFSINV